MSVSSSDSDDDYLTQRDDRKGNYDREALVRKKLLENFYGKAVAASVPDDDSSVGDNTQHSTGAGNVRRSKTSTAGKDDMDSPSFDAKLHAAHHIRDSSVYDLLETEDRVALQVRTLDSTMQTLVYENYSRFIDATDAIRSIGVNVQANEQGLRKLTEGMESIDSKSKEIEDALGSLRDQVAEKIRIKRLLTRLDALLKLPQTLREQINLGKYRSATRSFLSASSILKKHSEGFESLKTIETECSSILSELRQNLKRKMLHWSGRISVYDEMPPDYKDEYADKYESEQSNALDAPKTMQEIFECASTLFILKEERPINIVDENSYVEVMDKDLNIDDLQSMAVSASMRLLDRLLDGHLLEVQERRFATQGLDGSILDMKTSGGVPSIDLRGAKLAGSWLIPREFLDAVLEGATLFGMCFGSNNNNDAMSFLNEFVSEALSSFFSHVRSILYEESIEAAQSDDSADEDVQDEFNSAAYNEISGALTLLVQYIRELAAGLALPDVGINPEYAAKLVDQTLQLTETMVRRRVDQKFLDLRLSVVKHCLLPFVDRAIEERENAIVDGKAIFSQIVHVGSNTLSDCLQLVDDAIRSIFSGGLADPSADLPDLKDAVYGSSFGFASWMANAFEVLAGDDSVDPKRIIDAMPFPPQSSEFDDEKDAVNLEIQPNSVLQEERSDLGSQERALIDLLEAAQEKLKNSDRNLTGLVNSDFILAIGELCRLAQVSVPENIRQSIAAHAGGNKKKTRGMFPTGEVNASGTLYGDADEISARFKLAESRILVLYATNAGIVAGNIWCNNLRVLPQILGEEMPVAPSKSACEVLKIAKTLSMQCFDIFGGKMRAGPIPEWENDSYTGLQNSRISRKTGLQLDVERMFKERITVFPHPSETLELSRNGVLFLFFKILIREFIENVRFLNFSVTMASQLLVDIYLLRHMVPHYISNDFNEKGTNACAALSSLFADAVEVVEDRLDGSFLDIEDLKRDSREVVMFFFSSNEENQFVNDFILPEN